MILAVQGLIHDAIVRVMIVSAATISIIAIAMVSYPSVIIIIASCCYQTIAVARSPSEPDTHVFAHQFVCR